MSVFTGAGVAIITPMKENGEVNYERVSTLIVNTIKQEKIKNITFDRL